MSAYSLSTEVSYTIRYSTSIPIHAARPEPEVLWHVHVLVIVEAPLASRAPGVAGQVCDSDTLIETLRVVSLSVLP